MKWILRIIRFLPVVLIAILIIGIAFDPLNLIYKRDKSIKRMESGENKGDGQVDQNREEKQEPVIPQTDENPGEVTPQQGQSSEQAKAETVDKKDDGPDRRPKDYFMTFDELMSIEKISLRDKITGMAILSKLGKKEIDKLIDIANGGITMGEFEAMKLLLEEALSKDDFDKLNDIMLRNRRLYAEGKLAK